jgi:hypothetical protein
MRNNLVYRTKTGSFHQHYGRENVIRNNILVDSLNHQVQRSRAEKHLSFTFANNIVYYHTGKLLDGQWKDDQVAMRDNVYWKAEKKPEASRQKPEASGDAAPAPSPGTPGEGRGEGRAANTHRAPPASDFPKGDASIPLTFDGKPLDAWQQSGKDTNSVVADPRFLDPGAGDFRLHPDSPALKRGFQPFDYTKAGVYGDASWKKLAAEQTAAPLRVFPPAPPAGTP